VHSPPQASYHALVKSHPPPEVDAGMWSGAIPQHPVETTSESFSALGLSVPTLEVLLRIGFFHPTPIQAAVIPAAIEGRDILGLAETGSGKTAAFALPIAERLLHGHGLRGLVLAPTRELALQTKAFLDLFGQFHGLRTVALIGGVALGPQTDELRRKPDIAVATPGRLADHLERRNLTLGAIEVLVLDEADHMLDMGFLPQVQRLLRHVPPRRQTMLFSATMPPPIERLVSDLLADPVRIDVLPRGGAARGISHRLYLVEPENKKACLLALLLQELGSTLVFIRRRSDAEWLSRVLEREGQSVERLHGDLSQAERLRALRGFREGKHRILVATDVAARGLDVPSIRHIVNFELPETVDDYIHRAGRTARGAARGLVSSIATWKDRELIAEIEHRLGEKLARCAVGSVPAYDEPKPRRPSVRRRRLL
jgi:ATP-dependent RNA helicase RhlE